MCLLSAVPVCQVLLRGMGDSDDYESVTDEEAEEERDEAPPSGLTPKARAAPAALPMPRAPSVPPPAPPGVHGRARKEDEASSPSVSPAPARRSSRPPRYDSDATSAGCR